MRRLLSTFTFKPKKWATFCTLIMLAILLNLGFWQLRRADQKQIIVDNYQQQAAKPAVDIAALPTQTDLLQYHTVTVAGFYDNAHSILLDNQMYQGKVGYYVLTPLRIENQDKAVLINRGWIEQLADRRELPQLATVDARQAVQGMVYIPPQKSFMLDRTQNQEAGWPKRVQVLDTAALAQQLGYPLQTFVIWLDAGQEAGFVRDWQPKYLKPETHLGYAVQWFALAAALLVIYIIVNIQRRKPKQHVTEKSNSSS